ncbi:MAG TPA: hypothetical protein P5298_14740 [Spirochaetia bacterium]|nr:hypothetical protein [Spirochaetia bacterium]
MLRCIAFLFPSVISLALFELLLKSKLDIRSSIMHYSGFVLVNAIAMMALLMLRGHAGVAIDGNMVSVVFFFKYLALATVWAIASAVGWFLIYTKRISVRLIKS